MRDSGAGRRLYRYAGNGEWDQTGTGSDGQRALESPLEQIGSMLVGANGSLYLLLASQLDPRGNTSSYVYDADGRVIQTTDQATGTRTWGRTTLGASFTVTSSTPLGRETVQTISRSSDGSKGSTRTDAAGLVDVTTRNQDGSLTREFADGTSVSSTDVTDMPLAVSALRRDTTTVTLPSGLSSTVVTVRERTVETTGDPLSVGSTTATVQQLGSTGVWEVSHDTDAGLVLVRSPEGRETESSLDAKGRATSFRSGADATVSVTRDGQGRPTEVRQGARASSLAYGANGLVSTVTDPLTRTTQAFYDEADRLTRQVLADGREITLGYDSRGNPTSVTPAGRPAHTYAYSPVNLVTEYRPPAVDASDPATRFSYDLDRALTGITRPDGLTVGMVYDAAGRIQEVGFPGGLVEFGYDGVTGNLTGVNAPYGGALSMSYDGALPTQMQWTGEVAGSLGLAYDDQFRLAQLTVNGADPVSYAYDEDDLLVQAGALSATRDAVNGRLTGTTLGSLSTGQSYSGFGELASMTATYASTSLLEATYARDALGRIETKVEVLGGNTTTYAYTYDLTGRLTQVTADGVAVEAYAYDTNGNRTSFTGPGGVVAATYDAQDRLLTYGSNSYTYTAAGELTSKVQGANTTGYTYDVLGNLLRVDLPDGTAIEYVVDGVGRRVGRKVNGVLARGWLYQDALNPVAELDGTGAVVSRFVYGTRSYVPDYMVRGGDTFRIVSDERGSVRLVVDVATGAVAQELAYDAFGRVLVDTNPGFQPFGFAGGLYDTATGLVRFGARDYDAEVTATGWTAASRLRTSPRRAPTAFGSDTTAGSVPSRRAQSLNRWKGSRT